MAGGCLDGGWLSNISLLGYDNRRYRYNVGYGGGLLLGMFVISTLSVAIRAIFYLLVTWPPFLHFEQCNVYFLQISSEERGMVSICLFGSYTRGEAREDSDIDIAIEIRSEKKSLGNFLGIRRYLEQQLGKTVDLGIESTLKPLAREMGAKNIIYV